MVKPTDLSRARVRIEPNTDPKRAIDFLYDNPIEGSKRSYGKPMAGDGLVTAKQHAEEVRLQRPQFPEDRHGAGYCPDVPSDWRRGMGSKHAEGRPGFNRGTPRSPAKSLGGGKDCWKSPFSAAGRNYGGK
jgi:hypothetical protein